LNHHIVNFSLLALFDIFFEMLHWEDVSLDAQLVSFHFERFDWWKWTSQSTLIRCDCLDIPELAHYFLFVIILIFWLRHHFSFMLDLNSFASFG